MLKDRGSCPLCGIQVPRLLASLRGRMREIYTCPDHGAIAYGAQDVTVQEWNELNLARFIQHVPPPSWAKTLAAQGVEHFGHA